MAKILDITSRLELIKIDRGREKKCTCKNRNYVIDAENRTVECETCGTLVDPIDAMIDLVARYEEFSNQTQKILDERRAVERYHTRNRVLNHLFKSMLQHDDEGLVPCCPHCDKPFDFADLRRYINKRFIKKE